MDEEIEKSAVRRKPGSSSRYGERDLKGLKVAHDIESFKEDRQVILTLQDQDVLGEDGDTLININMIDDEKYKKNVEVKKQNPLHYGYDVYEDQYDEFGNFIGRGMLSKYDDVIEGDKRNTFTIGESRELIQEQQRKALEVKAKLQGKTLESLNVAPLKIASDHFTEEELTKFKKPKKKVKKIRQKLKADDLLELGGDQTVQTKDLGSRNKKSEKKTVVLTDDMLPPPEDLSSVKIEPEDEDLEHILSKARRLKQKEKIIKRDVQVESFKPEVKMEVESDEETPVELNLNNFITLNQTAEFCRTLGDIPTYGMAGNRDETTDMMEIDENSEEEEVVERRGKWNNVNPNEEPKLIEGVPLPPVEPEDVAILDEEPDVASGVANALKLAMSKGYLEKDDDNRPSNARFAHLQAQHYSIEDKAYGEDDKYSRRGGQAHHHFSGPLSEFSEKKHYRPNVKLEYIDDNNQKLTPKEAFRYLSHKFHGKGPGKNKIEKRLKKMEQEGVSLRFLTI
jgi:U4/U6.U5 tri-snRNP-associated protein 1